MVDTLIILRESGKNTVTNYSNDVQIVFEDYSIENENEYLQYSKSGNNLVIERYIGGALDVSLDSSLVLSNFFKLSPDEITMTINGDFLLDQAFVEIEGKGKINGTFLDDYIMGSEGKDTVYVSGGADDIETYDGNDTIYTSKQGSWVWAGQGNDKIYVTEVEDGGEFTYENIFVFNPGDGSDTIYNSTSKDYIEVYGYTSENFQYVQKGNNLVIQSTSNENDSITLIDYFRNNNGLEVIKFINENYEEEYINISDQNLVTESQGNVVVSWNNESAIIDLTNKKNAITYINGEGTKTINLKVLNGNTVINLGNAVTDIDVNINSINSRTGLPYDCNTYYSVSHDGKDLLINNQIDTGKSKDVLETITIKNYFANSNLQDSISLSIGNEAFISINQEFLQYVGLSLEGVSNKNNFLDGQNLDYGMAFFGGNKNDVMIGNTTIGCEFYTGQKGAKQIFSGSNSDRIYVENFSNTEVMINDNSAFKSDEFNREYTGELDQNQNPIPNELYEYTQNDKLYLNNSKKGEGAFIFFDVEANGQTQPDYSPNLYITKNANILSFMTPKYKPGFVSIENWFEGRVGVETNGESDGNGKIDHIYYNNGEIVGIDDFISRVTDDVKICLDTLNSALPDNKKFKSAMDVLERGSKTQKQAIINCYTKENAEISLVSHSEGGKIVFNGSTGNDVINVNDNYIVNAGKGNDKVLRYDYKDAEENRIYAKNYNLNGEDGNDVLEAGRNTVLDGGAGINVMTIDSASDALIINSKGNDYVHLVEEDLASMTYLKEGNDLVIQGSNGSTTLKDYFKFNGKSSVKGIIDYSANDALLRGFYGENCESSGKTIADFYKDATALEITKAISELENKQTITELLTSEDAQIKNDVIPKGDKFTGTAYNDKIDAQEVRLFDKKGEERKVTDKGLTLDGGNGNDEIDGTRYSDTIKGGNGNDTITGGSGNDIIYGGASTYIDEGNYSNNLYFNIGDDNDTIQMDPKGKDTIIFGEGITQDDIYYKIDGKDLILSYSDEDSIRIKNYMSTPADKISVDEVQFSNGSSFNISDRLMFTPNDEGYWEEEDEYYKLYEGTDGNDFIYVNNTKGYEDIVVSGAGNDTIQFNSKYAGVFDMEGDDRYIINSLSNSAEIFDNAGIDTMVINAKKEDLNIVFNVFEDDYGLEDLENYTPEFENFNGFYDLFIMSKKSLNDTIKIMSKKSLNDTIQMFTTGKETPIQYVSVYDYFNQCENYDEHGNPWDCKIETIQTKNATITYEDLNDVKEGIASWLATKDEYICAIQVLSSDNKADRDTLLAYYNSVWTDNPGVIPQ